MWFPKDKEALGHILTFMRVICESCEGNISLVCSVWYDCSGESHCGKPQYEITAVASMFAAFVLVLYSYFQLS